MKSLIKAFEILEFLAKENREVRLTEISEKLDINKSSVYKMLSVMSDFEYVQQNSDSNKYGLGSKYIKMGNIMLRGINVRTAALPFMEELGKNTGETINLMTRHGNKGIYVEIFESPQVNRVFQTVGTVEYLHACAIGKVLLSYMVPSEIEKIISSVGLPARTINTITDYDKLMSHLSDIKAQGYAIDTEEVCVGVFCVAAPILDHNGNAMAALSISAPTVRMSEELISKYALLVKDATSKISEIMYYKK